MPASADADSGLPLHPLTDCISFTEHPERAIETAVADLINIDLLASNPIAPQDRSLPEEGDITHFCTALEEPSREMSDAPFFLPLRRRQGIGNRCPSNPLVTVRSPADNSRLASQGTRSESHR